MNLMDYPFVFYTDGEEFRETNKKLFSQLKDRRLKCIYGAYDLVSESWFEEAPMIVEFEHGELAVATKSNMEIAVLWNEISHHDKPVWFDEAPELGWEEDLVWKVAIELEDELCLQIGTIDVDSSIIGLAFETTNRRFGIVDNGDVTIALEAKALLDYIEEERQYGFEINWIV